MYFDSCDGAFVIAGALDMAVQCIALVFKRDFVVISNKFDYDRLVKPKFVYS